MSRNKIQLQYGLGLLEFSELFPDEQSCRSHLQKLKWPNGFRCRRCKHDRAWRSERGKSQMPHWECVACKYQESLIAGTLFERTHLPLKKWFLAIELLTQAKTCLSSLQLHRLLRVNDKTALLLKHKIMAATAEAEAGRVLSGRVELDDVYLGGVREGGKSGRGAEAKVPFLAAVQTDPDRHPLLTVLTPVEAFSSAAVKKWSELHLARGTRVLTDGLPCFLEIAKRCQHERYTMNKASKQLANTRFKWVNTIISNIKSSFGGAFHSFDFAHYGKRYLGFMQYRFNRRFNLEECFYAMLETAAKSAPKTQRFLQHEETG